MTLTPIHLPLFKGYFFPSQKIQANFIEIPLVPETSSKADLSFPGDLGKNFSEIKPDCSVSLGVAFPNVLIGKETLVLTNSFQKE